MWGRRQRKLRLVGAPSRKTYRPVFGGDFDPDYACYKRTGYGVWWHFKKVRGNTFLFAGLCIEYIHPGGEIEQCSCGHEDCEEAEDE